MEPAVPSRKVLVVDDDPLIRVLLEEVLATWGYLGVPCEDGEEGWETYLSVPEARLGIIDWTMPRLTGVDLIRRIRAYEGDRDRPRTYLILLTSHSGRERVTEGLRSGADDYLVKNDDFQAKVKERLQVAKKQLQFEQMLAERHR